MVTEVIGPAEGDYLLGFLDGCDGGGGYRSAFCVLASAAILGYLGVAGRIGCR